MPRVFDEEIVLTHVEGFEWVSADQEPTVTGVSWLPDPALCAGHGEGEHLYKPEDAGSASPRPKITFPETAMTIETVPLPLPPTADPSKFEDFGREVRGVHPGRLTDEEFKEIEQLLYKVPVPSPIPCTQPLLIGTLRSTTHYSLGMLISCPRSSTNLQKYVGCR